MISTRMSRIRSYVRLGGVVAAAVAIAGGIGIAQSQNPGNSVPQPTVPGVTFTKDVAPILQRSCQKCHRPGSVAPMSLLTYEDVRPWARSIKARVSAREMPPWHIDRNIGISKFKDDPSLTEAEIGTIVRWVDAGAPRGNPADMPPPLQLGSGFDWQIGTPDIVVDWPEYTLAATGPDVLLNIVSDPGFKEDMWVAAVEVKPTDAATYKLVHHLTANLVADADKDPIGEVFGHYNMGMYPEVFPANSGKLLKAGTLLNWNMHLTPKGTQTVVRAQLGIKLFPKGQVPKYEAGKYGVGGFNTEELDIPAGVVSRTDGYTTLLKPALVYGFMSHMHYRGRAQCLEAIYPVERGQDMARPRTEMISCVSKYDPLWQLWYHYAEDVAPLLPAGTILHTMSWFDNTTANRLNPNPRTWVGGGGRTIDEMDQPRVGIIYLEDQDYRDRVAARGKQTQTASRR